MKITSHYNHIYKNNFISNRQKVIFRTFFTLNSNHFNNNLNSSTKSKSKNIFISNVNFFSKSFKSFSSISTNFSTNEQLQKLKNILNNFDSSISSEDMINNFQTILSKIEALNDLSENLSLIKEISETLCNHERNKENFLLSIEINKQILNLINNLLKTNLKTNTQYKYQDLVDIKKLYIELNFSCAQDFENLKNFDMAENQIKKNLSFLNENFSSSDSLSSTYMVLNIFNLAYIQMKKENFENNHNNNDIHDDSIKKSQLHQSIIKECLDIYKYKVKLNLDSDELKDEIFLKFELAKIHKFLGDYKEAIFIFENVKDNYEKNVIKNLDFVNSDFSEINLYQEMIDCYMKINDVKNTFKVITKLEEKILDSNTYNESQMYYLSFSKNFENIAHRFLYDLNDMNKSKICAEKSELYYNKFLNEFKQTIDGNLLEFSKASLYLFLSSIYEINEDFHKSIEYSEKFLGSIKILNGFEKSYDNSMRLYEGVKTELSNLGILDPINFKDLFIHKISIYFNISKCFLNINEIETANEKLKVCEAYIYSEMIQNNIKVLISEFLMKEVNYQEIFIDLKFKIGMLNKELKNFNEAMIDFDYVIEKSKNQEEIISAYFNKAIINKELNEYKKCEQDVLNLINYANREGVKLKENKMKELFEILMKVKSEA